jgi:hypothetical protein
MGLVEGRAMSMSVSLCRTARFAAALAVFSAAGFAQTAYSSVQRWEGVYPTKYADTRPLPAGQTFWDDPVIKASLTATLSPDQLKQLKTCWGALCTEDRIQLYDNMIAVHVCKKDSHDFKACQKWAAYVFLELDSGRTSVCWNTMMDEDLTPGPASLWISRSPSGRSSAVAVDACTSANAYQHAADQKNGKPVGNHVEGLAAPKIAP